MGLSFIGFLTLLSASYLFTMQTKQKQIKKTIILETSSHPKHRAIAKKPSPIPQERHSPIAKSKKKEVFHHPPLQKQTILCPPYFTVYFRSKLYFQDKTISKKIKKLAIWLKQNRNISLVINGHTDIGGGPRYNFILSQKRAQKVKLMLLQYGVRKKQIFIRAFGEFGPSSKKIFSKKP